MEINPTQENVVESCLVTTDFSIIVLIADSRQDGHLADY
jgi:hypothetical protein